METKNDKEAHSTAHDATASAGESQRKNANTETSVVGGACAAQDPDWYALLRLFANKASVREIVRHVVAWLPQHWQHAEIACARAVLHGEEFATPNYRPMPWRQIADIINGDKTLGTLEVSYLEERPIVEEGPFLNTERRLLDNVADAVARVAKNEAANVELLHSKEAVDAVNRAKTAFLANVSHEIRTPMTAILGFNDVLLENVHDPACIDAAITIKRNACYLLNLLNNILDLSKLEAGNLSIERVSCSPVHIVADVASLMRVRAQMERLSVRTEFTGAIPEKVVTDPVRVRQILINLISNAISNTQAGVIRVVTHLRQHADGKAALQFDVCDTGVGMSNEQIALLFQPFADTPAAVGKPRGPGLGLTITKHLVKLLGGSLSIRSVVGQGTTVSVTIDPGALERVAMLTDPSEVVIHRHDQPQTAPSALPKLQGRVLLVEDGPDNQRLISFILQKAGAEVVIAANGQEAIDRILADEAVTGVHKAHRLSSFDVVLMDMQMPVLDGYRATRRLRAMGYDSPIIALTAHAMSEDRQKCLDAGCDEYLTKPVDQRLLLDTVLEFQHRVPHCQSAYCGTAS